MDSYNNLRIPLRKFCGMSPSFERYYEENFTGQNMNFDLVYSTMTNYLLDPEHTLQIANLFPNELPYLVHLGLGLSGRHRVHSTAVHLRNCVVLSKLALHHKICNSYILQYFDTNPAPFEKIKEKRKKRKSDLAKMKEYTSFDVIDASYKFLKARPTFFSTKWDWSVFVEKYKDVSDILSKWLYLNCCGIVFKMSDKDMDELLYQYFNNAEDALRDCIVQYECATNAERQLYVPQVVSAIEGNTTMLQKINGNITNVCGILLPTIPNNEVAVSTIVEAPSTSANLSKIAMAVAANRAVCVQGPVGCGKTALVEYLAGRTGRRTGRELIKLQLGDQTDCRTLVGVYRSTDVPGEFVWQPGVLTQAVIDGSWILLEDIDSANMDIASVLSGLLENGYLTVPGYKDAIPISPGFQLFITQRFISTTTGYHKKQTNSFMLLEKYVLQVNVEPLSADELQDIISTSYAPLETISERIVSIFKLFSTSSESASNTSRHVSTRDLFKWCNRAVVDFQISSQASALKVLHDAIDIFCCHFMNVDAKVKFAGQVASYLGLIAEQANQYCLTNKPTRLLSDESLTVGRSTINRLDSAISNRHMRFCFTAPSARLMERIMCCVQSFEPVLLVGETGTGKTASVQYLATTLGQRLIVINMNQQSDSADLLGGFKPVNFKMYMNPLRQEFEKSFRKCFRVDVNQRFLVQIETAYVQEKWMFLFKLMSQSCQAALNRISNRLTGASPTGSKRTAEGVVKDFDFAAGLVEWTALDLKLKKLETQLKANITMAFSFIEGSLIRALKHGYWVLLDEINLANAETLECLSGLLEGCKGSVSLFERGDKAPVERHPNFKLFACMNPSTDVGKKDLPTGIRSRFTELFVEELVDRTDLILMTKSYLGTAVTQTEKLENIVRLYLSLRQLANESLTDGENHKPHFSLRTLCRALNIAAENPCGMFVRSMYEAFCLSFLTQLDEKSYEIVQNEIIRYIIGTKNTVQAVLNQPIPMPKSSDKYLLFEGYWVKAGASEPEIPDRYILTKSVRRNLTDLARVVSIGNLPVLIQGPTSVGKTSLINYLAKSSGNKCVRINNHEHTDLQEYIGTYMADDSGKLVFSEGLLVQAMRSGHWIILDELNLAPTDVLEALNRVLDDNRELFIPETQETVRANPNFKLFATQNPPGHYGGRKTLSRAFRNRFAEFHWAELPQAELEVILHLRCDVPATYAAKCLNVVRDLQRLRRSTAAFAGKEGYMTLRDLFRWGDRYRLAPQGAGRQAYDWDQHMADEEHGKFLYFSVANPEICS